VNAAVAIAFLVEVVIHAVLVRIDSGFGQDLFLNVGHDGSAFGVGYSGDDYPPFALCHTENGGLVAIPYRDARLHRFVGFYRAGKPLVVIIREHLAYLVEHAPRGFVRDA
jgi:hypothetical protein